MRLKGDFGKQGRSDDSIEGLAIDEDFAATRLRHLRREVEGGKTLLPQCHKVIQGQIVQFLWRFDVDNAIIGMGMHPVETGAISGNTNARRNGEGLTIDVNCEMDVNVVAVLLRAITGNITDRRMERIDTDRM